MTSSHSVEWIFYNLLLPKCWTKWGCFQVLSFFSLGFLFCFIFAILFLFVIEDSLLNIKKGGTSSGMPVTMSDLMGKEAESYPDTGQSPPGHGDNSCVLYQSNIKPSLSLSFFSHLASLMAQLVKNPPVMQETLVLFLGWKDPLQKG